MNELTKQMQQIMHPRAVLVAYECETTDYSTPRSYLELRPVNEKGRMGAGIPVTYEFMNSLVESYTESMSGIPHGRIPGNMLLCDPRKGRERYIWYNPPQKRKMYFQDGLHITDGTFNVPGVIYVVERECMDIHAFKGAIPRRADRTVSGTVLQCYRSGRLPGQLITKETAGHGFPGISGILGKAFLDERVLTFGRRQEPDPQQSGFSNGTCTEQSV